MTNQHAGASVLKGGLLQRYQLQAWVHEAPAGTATGPCAGRLGTQLLSELGPVCYFCHRQLCVAATGGEGNTQGLRQPASH